MSALGNILAFDLGTSSVRALVLQPDAVPVPGALARRKFSPTVDGDGAATLDAQAYLAALIECVDELHAAGRLDGVAHVAASAMWHSILPLDGAGKPLGPVLTWLDTRPRAAETATGPDDEAAFHHRTGAWWHPLYWTVRIPWLRERSGTAPAAFSGLGEFVWSELLGESPISVSQASGAGVLDLNAQTWDAEALSLAGTRESELPTLAGPGWRGRLRAEYAGRWPALADAEWAAPYGDGAASNVGSGAGDASRAAITVGTSAAVRVAQEIAPGQALPALPPQLWRYRLDHTRVVTGRAYSGGGNLFAWAQRALLLPEGDALEAALDEITPGQVGVWADPRFGGDRPPGMTPPGEGRLGGLGLTTTGPRILAGLMDGVCTQVAADLLVLESTVGRTVDVRLGGGAVAASAWWRRAFSTALAPRRVEAVENPEVGAVGAALIMLADHPNG
ncbi:gluconokinase [Catenuloplanes nepalensis]|uniref:Gluconokinase n=1 Tax=Catenuloplanes nepalensis TaxID=587533 RepID=A0ABT9MLJ7_9ACTN|nr:FGGY family carbohydrate kinase [Catenuloplanes nepalensis]MDP9792283.1 gluconokinase [Catenuloplanes nepalensis]